MLGYVKHGWWKKLNVGWLMGFVIHDSVWGSTMGTMTGAGHQAESFLSAHRLTQSLIDQACFLMLLVATEA